jgi:hypothetical protein
MFVHIPSREGPDLPCASVMCGADTELCTSNEVSKLFTCCFVGL